MRATRMAADLSLELPQHAQAMRSLARLLVGAQDADDLLQDVTLQVLSAAPPPGTWLPGWLRVVLRRRASNVRRSDHRRARREQTVAAAPADDKADPAKAAAHRETLARVTKALLELPDPYRDVLFQRFFQDLTPTAIAAATGQPLATVKSRLQRGLDLLRERVEARLGGDWRAAVTTAFGLDRALTEAAAATTAGALVLGGLQLLAAAGLAVGAWFAVDAALPSAPAAATSVSSAPAPAATADAAPDANATSPAARTIVAKMDAGDSTAAAALAVLRGRCVDGAGRPLAGVDVAFSASVSDGSRLEGWTRWQDPPEPYERRARTGADGVFGFTFAPLQPLVFELHLRGAGLVERSDTWADLEPGQVIETGDLAMIVGTRCIGRVVDRRGQPQGDVVVELERAGQPDEVALTDGGWSVTRSDGTFAFEQLLPPGDYAVRIAERRSLTPGRVLVDGRSPAQSFEIVTDPATVGMHLAGIVVDERGEPVPHAAMRGDSRVSGSTGTDGRFRIARPEGAVDAFAMTVDASDFEPWCSREPLAWGRNDVRIELQRGAPLDIDAATADGAPVRAFQLRLRRLDDSGRADSGGRVLGAGEHDGGRLHVASLRRGRWLLRVEPRDRALELSPFTAVEVGGGEPVHVAVIVPRRGERVVRVQLRDGAPVVGSTVELLDLCGQGGGRRPDEYERWLAGIDRPSRPLPIDILQTARTGADGTVALAGPTGVPLALRIRGTGHLAAIQDGLVLGETGPFVVTVARGGTVAGKVAPSDVLAQFRRLAQLEPQGPWEENAPRVVLYRSEGGAVVDVSGGEEGRIGADGAFAVGGLRAGTWDLGLEYSTSDDGRCYSTCWAPLGNVVVRDDAVTERDVDLRPIAPGELSGLVLCNGRPFADAEGIIVRKERVRRDGSVVETSQNMKTDEAGRFTALLPPGEYHIELLPDREMFVPSERVFVAAGGRSEATFTFAAGTLHLRLLTAAGEPVRGAVPMFEDPSAGWGYIHDVGSNESGRLVVRLQAGEYEVRVPPRAVGTPALRRAWWQAHGTDAPQLLVAKIAIRGGDEVERELRLPPEWEQDVR